jgi:putative transposase
VKFGFIAKYRGIWPADWLCGALGVSRGGFYAWLTRPRSQRSWSHEELGAKVRASFLASDRTYGARRVWRDLLAEGYRVDCIGPATWPSWHASGDRRTSATDHACFL